MQTTKFQPGKLDKICEITQQTIFRAFRLPERLPETGKTPIWSLRSKSGVKPLENLSCFSGRFFSPDTALEVCRDADSVTFWGNFLSRGRGVFASGGVFVLPRKVRGGAGGFVPLPRCQPFRKVAVFVPARQGRKRNGEALLSIPPLCLRSRRRLYLRFA